MLRVFRTGGRLALVVALLIAMSVFVSGGASHSRAQAGLPVTSAYVPSDAVLYVAIDTHLLSPQWVQAATLAQRINANATIESIPESVIGQAIGDDVEYDITPFIGGEIALVYLNAGSFFDETSSDEIADDPELAASGLINGVVVVAVPASLELAEREMRSALERIAQNRGFDVEETTYGDATIVSVAADDAAGEPGAAYVVTGDAIALAFDPLQLEPIVDRVAGEGASIAEIDGFDAAWSHMPEDQMIVGLLNGPSLVNDGRRLEGVGPAIEAFVPGGADGITTFAVRSEPDGFRVDTRTVSADGEPVQSFGKPTDGDLLDRLPADTQIAVSGHDLAGTRVVDGVLAIVFNLILGALGDMFVSLDDEAATLEPLPDTFEAAVDGAYGLASAFLGFDIQQDLVSLLDGEFVLGVRDAGGENPDASIGFISETSDPDTVESTLQNISFVAAFLFGSDSGNASGGMSIATDAGHIELGVENAEVQIEFVGGSGTILDQETSLADSEAFAAATAPLPESRNLLVFVNIESLQRGPAPAVSGTFGMEQNTDDGPAFAFVTFDDGDEMGGQGYLVIPEP